MNIEDLVLVEVFAEGYYSGQTTIAAVVMSGDFVEEHIQDFCTVYFDGLDGKHSEVEGVLSTKAVTPKNVKDVIATLSNSGDDSKIWEQLLDGIDPAEIDKQIDIDWEFYKRINVTTTIVYYLDGVEL